MRSECRHCDYVAAAEKAERERDEALPAFQCYQDRVLERDAARATINELVAALEICSEWMDDNVPADSWGLRDKQADAHRVAALEIANAALAKAKETKP